jgi:hypothetical protein
VEPDVRSGVLINTGAGSLIQYNALSPAGRSTTGAALQARTPSLINSPGLTSIGGVPVSAPFFNENMPLRNQPPVINTVAGAMAIQEFFEHSEWVGMSADAAAYAAHLRKDPLAGVPVKPVVIVIAKGDETIANPLEIAVVRAGDLADWTIVYRNDLAFAENNQVPKNPHVFANQIESPVPLVRQIAFGLQDLIATFLNSDGTVIAHPEPSGFFEDLIDVALFEALNFLP